MRIVLLRNWLIVVLATAIISLSLIPVGILTTPLPDGNMPENRSTFHIEYALPPPADIDMPFEQAMARRMSVREFTDEPVTDEELSTILWHAYGYRDDGSRTISDIGGVPAVGIYVLKEDAVYRYDALNHTLVLYLDGDYRSIVGWQYEAPVQLAIVQNEDVCDEYLGCVQIGGVYQNIQFTANALNLGTVVTGEVPSPIENIGLPAGEKGRIVMPLGHPRYPYNFVYRPMWLSFLPRPQESDVSLTDAIIQRSEGSSFTGTVSTQEQSQLLWSAYGFSYYLDRSGQDLNIVKRHRTVPSAHGYYPLKIYAVTESGTYRYEPNLLININRIPIDFIGIPILPFLLKITGDDVRGELSLASQPPVASAPLSLVIVLDIDMTRPPGRDDFSGMWIRWLWHLEAGSCIHNVLLQATTLGLSANVFPVTDDSMVLSLFGLDDGYDPMYVIPIGER